MNAISRMGAVVVAAVVTAAGAGCATHAQMPQPIQSVPGVAYGQVQSVELVRAQSQTTGSGAIIGGLIGAVIGHQIGDGNGRSAATGVGAVGGAILGNEIERQQRGAQDFLRVAVLLDDGTVRSMDLPRATDLRVGDRVRIERDQVVRF